MCDFMENQIFSNISNFGRYVKKVESAIKTRILTLGKKYFRMLLWLQDLLKIISYTMEREKSSSIYELFIFLDQIFWGLPKAWYSSSEYPETNMSVFKRRQTRYTYHLVFICCTGSECGAHSKHNVGSTHHLMTYF